ncbi:MAG: HAD-IB family phosphatase [Phycisphaerales bacterium]
MSAPAVLFDYDGTLVLRDSTRFLVLALVHLRPWLAPRAALGLAALRLARTPRALQERKCALVGALVRGLDEAALRPALEVAAYRMGREACAPALAALDAHARAGRRVVVVSASAGFYLRHALAPLGAEIVATEFELRDGRHTGRVAGEICYGEAKPAAVRALLGPDAAIEDAWSDSLSDLPMMLLARERHWLCPPADPAAVARADPKGTIVRPTA